MGSLGPERNRGTPDAEAEAEERIEHARLEAAERLRQTSAGRVAGGEPQAGGREQSLAEPRGAEEGTDVERVELEAFASALAATEQRLSENRRLASAALKRAAERLEVAEARARQAEERAQRAERLAAVRVEEAEQHRRLREMLDRISAAEARASAAEERARRVG